MQVTIAPPHELTGRFGELDRRRSELFERYACVLEADPRMRGRVLDVGCGCDYPTVEPVARVLKACDRLDGVDPLPCVKEHPGLTERWCGEFEAAPIPDGAYDAVFTFFVAEHIRDATSFFGTAARVLKPGGVVHALTPHALHPFALISRAFQAINIKYAWRRFTRQKVNEYPAYYRANRLGSVVRAARRTGFVRAAFQYVPCVQWDQYFPRPIRFLPWTYDRLMGVRVQRAAQILIYHVEKSGGEASPAGDDA